MSREWWKSNGISVINDIVKEGGVEVSAKFCPVQDGYFWVQGDITSDGAYDDPMTALEAWIVFRIRLSQQRPGRDLEF